MTSANLRVGDDLPQGVVCLAGVDVSYRKRSVLRSIDLNLVAGAITILIGANGSGKTSLLKVIAGMRRPDRGSVSLGGAPSRRRAVFTFEEPNLYPHLTGAANIRILGGTDEARAKLAQDALEVSDELLRRRAKGYSFGQRRKVTLLAAFSVPGTLPMLFDEPTNGLDPKSIEGFSILVSGAREDNREIFVTGQDLSILESVADRVYVLREGRLKLFPDWRAYARNHWMLEVSCSTPQSEQKVAQVCRQEGIEVLVKEGSIRCFGSEGCLRNLLGGLLANSASTGILSVNLRPRDLDLLLHEAMT